MHADRPFPQRITHDGGKLGLDVIFFDNVFQPHVDGVHLLQAHQRKSEHQQQHQREADAQAELCVFGEHVF